MAKHNGNPPELLTQGSLNDEAFELLLSLTSIRSEPLIEALRDYYVGGLTKSQAYTKHGADKTSFSRKLSLLAQIFETVRAFNKIYTKR